MHYGPGSPRERRLIAAVPCKVHTVLTDDGTYVTTPGNSASAVPLVGEAIARKAPVRAHGFALANAQNDDEHWLTRPRHPWANG